MNQSKGKTVFAWLIQVVLALLFVLAALGKLRSDPNWIARFNAYGYSAGFCLLIGALEAAGGIGLLIPPLAGYAALGLIGIMIGASYTHVTHHEAAQLVRPIAFIVLLAVVVYMRKPWPMKSNTQEAGQVARQGS
jgi:putative oxidoreductase